MKNGPRRFDSIYLIFAGLFFSRISSLGWLAAGAAPALVPRSAGCGQEQLRVAAAEAVLPPDVG